jgi:DNA-binding NarL/FixJ family response regulator
VWGVFPLVDALVERDDVEAADVVMRAAGADLEPAGELGQALALEARGRLRCAQGRWPEARDDLQRAAERWAALGVAHPGIAAWRADAATALAALGDAAGAERLAREQVALAERLGTPSPLARALRALALTAPRAAEVPILERAAGIAAEAPAGLERTRTLHDLGAALRRAGRRREAREPLRQALDLADRGSLSRQARLTRAELTAAGARPRRAALSGPGARTAAEHRVASLAAGGRTNREIAQELFVTQRTVETHLSHCFRKLDIASRDRLGAALDAGAPDGREAAPPQPTPSSRQGVPGAAAATP